ncbi:MAG: VpaChn25_0724 family phage protein [Shimia sp.]
MFGWNVLRVETERRRLTVLQYLAEIPGYEANEGVLRDHCVRLGVPTTPDQLRVCLAWLEEHELLTLRRERDVHVARITGTGRDVARGGVVIPGVMPPDP